MSEGGSLDGGSDSPWMAALASGFFAAVVAVATTVGIEKFGGTLGGVLATVPTTIVPASIGLFYQLPLADDLRAALFTVPLGMLVDGVFLLHWRLLPPRLPARWSLHARLCAMTGLSLTSWALLASLAFAVMAGLQGSAVGVGGVLAVGSLALLCSAGIGVASVVTPPDAPAGDKSVSWRVLCMRGVFAGSSITVTVLVAHLSDVLAGIMSVFPAIFVTSMVAVWLAQGEGVTTGAVGPMMLGSCSVSLYALLFATIAPATGPWGAVVLCWPLAVGLTSVPSYRFIEWRRRVKYRALPPANLDDDSHFDEALEDIEFDSATGRPQIFSGTLGDTARRLSTSVRLSLPGRIGKALPPPTKGRSSPAPKAGGGGGGGGAAGGGRGPSPPPLGGDVEDPGAVSDGLRSREAAGSAASASIAVAAVDSPHL